MNGSLSSLSSIRNVPSVEIHVSPGELIDKITILEIKAELIKESGKRLTVRHELTILREIRDETIPDSVALERLTADLRMVNKKLWMIEDEIREQERNKVFDDRFVALARSVYRNNDRRASLKSDINALLGAEIAEQKSYEAY
ncbi:MAG: hypothetical protein HOM58_09470 [Rhodospirillaceae bacterium]|jgi:hypothetical protein|nr:hypothetical protein [Rhodospirillaceae bacterium]MBT5459145.1 hypothetical protein [Rhodospirillaceae bacterium]